MVSAGLLASLLGVCRVRSRFRLLPFVRPFVRPLRAPGGLAPRRARCPRSPLRPLAVRLCRRAPRAVLRPGRWLPVLLPLLGGPAGGGCVCPPLAGLRPPVGAVLAPPAAPPGPPRSLRRCARSCASLAGPVALVALFVRRSLRGRLLVSAPVGALACRPALFWGCVVPVSARLLSRVAGSAPWFLGLGVPPRRGRLACRPPARLASPAGRARAWLVAVRRSGPCAPRFSPAVLVASCPRCSARCSSRAVGPSSPWLLCPFCGCSAYLPAAAWSFSRAAGPDGGRLVTSAPARQLALF